MGHDEHDVRKLVSAFVRAFGLHQPDQTPCGQPVPVSEAHAVAELHQRGPLTQLDLARRLRLEKSTVSRLVTWCFEADQFTKGVYADPATIHGTNMPGLRELQAGAGRVQIRYEQIPAGARITYSSTDQVLLAALHAWFDAQTSDHHMPGLGMGQ